MGYYTWYELHIRPNFVVPESKWDQLQDEIDKMNVFDDGDVHEGLSAYSKWYDCSLDMLKLSMLFPEFRFELHGDGEESDDFWIEYYIGGYSQFCKGYIIFDDFNPELLEPPDSGIDFSKRKYSYEESNKGVTING